MTEYEMQDAARDLEVLRAQVDVDAVERLAEHIDRLEARALAAERVCEAAVEVSTPSVKGERIAQRQTRFLRALAEWRATRE